MRLLTMARDTNRHFYPVGEYSVAWRMGLHDRLRNERANHGDGDVHEPGWRSRYTRAYNHSDKLLARGDIIYVMWCGVWFTNDNVTGGSGDVRVVGLTGEPKS